MWHPVCIVFALDKVNPQDICLVVKFAQVLHEQGVVLQPEVDDTKTTFIFRQLNN
jgi:hypothetical protein